MAKKISELYIDNPVAAPTGVMLMELVDGAGDSGAALLSAIQDFMLTIPVGAVGTPGLKFVGDLDTGIYQPSDGTIAFSTQGQFVAVFTAGNRFVIGDETPQDTTSGNTFTQFTPKSQILSNAADATFLVARFSTNASPPYVAFNKARGTIAAPETLAVSDAIAQIAFSGWSAVNAAWRPGASIRVFAATLEGTNGVYGTRIQLDFRDPVVGNNFERFAFDYSGSFQMGGTNIVIDAERCFINRITTLASLSGFTPSQGRQIFVSDIGGGNGLLVGDGTAWRRNQETGTERRTTDAAFTLIPLSSAPTQLCEGTLTADRAITLSTTGAYDGAMFEITRTGAGAFNYIVAHNGGTKNIATNGWAVFKYFTSLAAWQLVAAGTL